MTHPRTEWILKAAWFVGSDHSEDGEPDYRFDTEGWPFFIGINREDAGLADLHIASDIQELEVAQAIVEAHNDSCGYKF